MADYVSREVARERLRKACKAGVIVSALLLVGGLCYGGVAAIIATNTRLPEFLVNFLYLVIPTLSDTLLALVECTTRAVLFLLIGLLGILMFRKMSKTGDAFRSGQLRQLRFISFLLILLGFLPTVAGNIAKVIAAIQRGGSPMTVMSFSFDAMCIVAGLFVFMAARALVAGSLLGTQEQQLAADPTTVTSVPNYDDVPDLTRVTTAVATEPTLPDMPTMQVPSEDQIPKFVNDPEWDRIADEIDSAANAKQ